MTMERKNTLRKVIGAVLILAAAVVLIFGMYSKSVNDGHARVTTMAGADLSYTQNVAEFGLTIPVDALHSYDFGLFGKHYTDDNISELLTDWHYITGTEGVVLVSRKHSPFIPTAALVYNDSKYVTQIGFMPSLSKYGISMNGIVTSIEAADNTCLERSFGLFGITENTSRDELNTFIEQNGGNFSAVKSSGIITGYYKNAMTSMTETGDIFMSLTEAVPFDGTFTANGKNFDIDTITEDELSDTVKAVGKPSKREYLDGYFLLTTYSAEDFSCCGISAGMTLEEIYSLLGSSAFSGISGDSGYISIIPMYEGGKVFGKAANISINVTDGKAVSMDIIYAGQLGKLNIEQVEK